MREARQNGEPGSGHAGTIPVGIALAAAQGIAEEVGLFESEVLDGLTTLPCPLSFTFAFN